MDELWNKFSRKLTEGKRGLSLSLSSAFSSLKTCLSGHGRVRPGPWVWARRTCLICQKNPVCSRRGAPPHPQRGGAFRGPADLVEPQSDFPTRVSGSVTRLGLVLFGGGLGSKHECDKKPHRMCVRMRAHTHTHAQMNFFWLRTGVLGVAVGHSASG